MAVNLSKNRLALLTAYQDVINENSATDWALYTYEGDSNDLTLASSGDGGLSEIAGTFDNTCVMYGFCSLKEPTAALPRYILINWVGEDVPDARKCACASHVATIAEFFQVSEGVDVIINASSAEDIEPSAIGQRLTNGTVPVASPVLSRLRMRDEEHGENVGTSYQKTNAEIEMKKINREEFWEQAKREEEMRKEEERKKAAEERQKFEEERMELERKEQEEREKRYREREQQIEEHRKKLQDEEEARERTRNQTLITVESCEDSAQDKRESEVEEAAAIIAQRSENPRDFFKQKERAVASGVDSSPVPTQRTDDIADGISGRNMAAVAPTPIPKIVTTPIQEEDDSRNEWAPESEQRAPVQESAQSKPTQSVAPQARVTNASPSDHPFQQEADSQLDLWETSGPPAGTAPLQTAHLVDLMGDSPEPSTAGAAPALPQPLLSFDELPEPPDASGPQMTLSYQHALQHASGSGSQDLDDGQLLMTNGEMLLKEGTQASEGYFSQSQEEEFAQSEECSAKVTPSPVFYNKPPEIDITCWDTDPVMEDDD
ncbi:drebrin isoform X4 [Megalops cyprinoides]|uniref:drebrin isoform X4 n=1 Tax=Megalops cyprinoides TaxID=118141 RepID=UPI0018640519|nr:drebrin isoform X4 [Megalops cyprinoides]